MWSIQATVGELLIIFGGAKFISNMVGSKGRFIQPKLFKKWGGAPTIQILRHQDNTISKVTKQRYHNCLASKVNTRFPSEQDERDNPSHSDDIYQSGVDWLLEETRNIERFPLVISENIWFGFSRNLFALKKWGIILNLVILAINCFLIWLVDIRKNTWSLDYLEALIFKKYFLFIAVPFLFLFIWIFLIREGWVKNRGNAYAKALLRSCEMV